MRTTDVKTEYSLEERQEMLRKMKEISDAFYYHAVRVGCHGFIEFCGLMNEYIKICAGAHEQGIDFTRANTHTGKALPVQEHHLQYLAEKLDCIYGPALADEKNRKTFLSFLLPQAPSKNGSWSVFVPDEQGGSKCVVACATPQAANAALRLLDPDAFALSGPDDFRLFRNQSSHSAVLGFE